MSSARELISEGCRPTLTCRSLSVPRSTFYRHRGKTIRASSREKPEPANKISKEDRNAILDLMHEERFIDLTPREIVPCLADNGVYLGSIRSFYRILSENNESIERRLQARRVHPVAPILESRAPNEVWSWDITRLPGPNKGVHYFLYVMIDLYSRYVVGWMLSERENARRAKTFIRETAQKHLGREHTAVIHNDRGSPMKAGTTRELISMLGLTQSFSRPRTSDDNPYSEAQFRTLKYHHTFPNYFNSIEHGISFLDEWFTWYNNEHYHTGLNLHHPADVYHKRMDRVMEVRRKTMEAAAKKYPERFSGGVPVVQTNPEIVGINLKFKAEILKANEFKKAKTA